VPARVPDRTPAGVDRGAGWRSARTTGLVPALEEAFALGGTERKPLGRASCPMEVARERDKLRSKPSRSRLGENRRSGRAACALSREASQINGRTPLLS
jgi:hypothetical protein